MLRWRRQDLAVADNADNPDKASKRGAERVTGQNGDVSNRQSEWPVRSAMILTAFFLFCGLIYNAGKVLFSMLDKPVTQVTIEGGMQYLDTSKMVTRLVAGISSSLLSQDVAQIKALALEEPWVNGASVTRVWPNGLRVKIQEQIPVARWGDKGLLNHQGDIFWPQQLQQFAGLPILRGPSTDTARVMRQYYTLSQFFKRLDSSMIGLTLQARGAWTLLLNNNIEVELGREHVLARLKRFLQLYRGHLYQQAERIERVDVRYTNGVAVQWLPVLDEKKQQGNDQ